VTNQLLARLARADARLLEPHLEPVDLPVRKQVQARNKRVERIYFPDSGIASVVANHDTPIEVGMTGRDGMTGVSVLLGTDDLAEHEIYMQMAGKGQWMTAGRLREAIAKSTTLHQALLRYVQVFLRQTTETALANGRGKIEERLARWLLMAHDRGDGDELKLTHEFLAVMLGVRRSGITTALQELERKGLIAHRRAFVTILDREGLEEGSNGAYSGVKPERSP
jgi:CRP-like cAMP-binding protein